MKPASPSSPLRRIDATRILQNGRKLIYFGGCDYFRLSRHPRILKAVRQGLNQAGLNVSASRMTTGNDPLYDQLEQSLARFFDVEAATLTATGYAADAVAAQALAGRFSHVLIDERAHPSLKDAARMMDVPVIRFRHRDASDVARIIKRLGSIKPQLMTDGLFSHDGGVAPLRDYLKLLPRGGMMLVDDAHGAGTIGRDGRGSAQYCGIGTNRVLQTITLSKSFGVFGGAVLGSKKLRAAIVARSGIFIGSTPLPLPLAAAALESVAIQREKGGELRQRLNRNVLHLRECLRQRGVSVPDNPGPIVSLVPKQSADAAAVSKWLRNAGIHPPFLNYPGGPKHGQFRFAISSEHTLAQLERLAGVLGMGTKLMSGGWEF